MSNLSASVNSRELITNSQKVLDKDAIIGLNFEMKKGNEQPLMFTVNEMNGNFYNNNDEFYRIVSKFKFTDLNTLYTVIINEARVLKYNEIFMSIINEYFNLHFMTCLSNYYKNSPSFFNVLFPVNDDLVPLKNKNIHLSFQKYYYLICIIQYVNEYKDDEKLKSLPIDFYNNIIDWAITRYDPNIMFQIEGPKRNQLITFDFAKHYETLISINNTSIDIMNYNKLVKLQNINDNSFSLLEALLHRENPYYKNPDYAREYIISIDTITLQQKEIIEKNNTKNLVFDLSYIDFGDSINDGTSSRIEDIDKLKTSNITTSKLNIKRLEKIFNNYSRMKISKLIVNKNTYITDLTQVGKVFVVFEGIQCSERTIVSSKTTDLAIPGRFVKNNNGDFEFEPYYEYTTYVQDRTRIKSCNLYLTTDNTHNIVNKIMPYPVYNNITRLNLYNVPLKIVDTNSIVSKTVLYNRFTRKNQYPDLLFRQGNSFDTKQQDTIEISNDNYYNFQLLNKFIVNEYYKNHVDKQYIDGTFSPNSATDTTGLLPLQSNVGLSYIINFELVDNDIKNTRLLLKYDYDTSLINFEVLTQQLHKGEDINAVLYNIFMKETEMNTINRIYNRYLVYNTITSKDDISYSNNDNITDIMYYNKKNEFNFIQYDKEIIYTFSSMIFDNNFTLINKTSNTVSINDAKYYFTIELRHKRIENKYTTILYIPFTNYSITIDENGNIKFMNGNEVLTHFYETIQFVITKDSYYNRFNTVTVYINDTPVSKIELNTYIHYNGDADINEIHLWYNVIQKDQSSYTFFTTHNITDENGNILDTNNTRGKYIMKYVKTTVGFDIYDVDNNICAMVNNGELTTNRYITHEQNTDDIIFVNPMYSDNLLLYNFNDNIIYNNICLCDLNNLLGIEYTKDMSYFDAEPTFEGLYLFENCYYEIGGVKQYTKYLNIYHDEINNIIRYNFGSKQAANYGSDVNTTQSIKVFKSTQYITNPVTIEVYEHVYNPDINDSIYAIISDEIKNNLKAFSYMYINEDGTSVNLNETDSIYSQILEYIKNYAKVSSDYTDDGIIALTYSSNVNNTNFNNIVKNFTVYVTTSYDNDKPIITLYYIKFNIIDNARLKTMVTYNTKHMNDIYLCYNELSSNWMMIYNFNNELYAIDLLNISQYTQSNYLNRISFNLSISNSLINSVNITLSIPTAINVMCAPFAHMFSIGDDNKMHEYNILTINPSNNNSSVINYNNNTVLLNIKPYFGSIVYWKRPIYYYRSLYNYSKNNSMIFEAPDIIPIHENTTIVDNDPDKKNNKTGDRFITNNLYNNLYELKGLNNDANPNIFNISGSSIDVYYNKSDIDITMNWN